MADDTLYEQVRAALSNPGAHVECGWVTDAYLDGRRARKTLPEWQADAALAVVETHTRQAQAQAWDERYDAAAWRSYQRTDISIGRSDEANPPNPYRADELDPKGDGQ